MLVVTGAPGAGKSAVLGRIVTTADADAVKELPASDAAVRATMGSVACAVHAKGKTTLEVRPRSRGQRRQNCQRMLRISLAFSVPR
jgi:hypothetical protein